VPDTLGSLVIITELKAKKNSAQPSYSKIISEHKSFGCKLPQTNQGSTHFPVDIFSLFRIRTPNILSCIGNSASEML
jgi:hypothetical protein